jgi:hypothetical protein
MHAPSDRSIAAVCAVLALALPTIASDILSSLDGPALIGAGPEIVTTLLAAAAVGWGTGRAVVRGGWWRAAGVGVGVGALSFPVITLAWLAGGSVELVAIGALDQLDVRSVMVAYAFLYFWLFWLYSLVFAVPIGVAWGILTRLMTRLLARGPRWPETASPPR